MGWGWGAAEGEESGWRSLIWTGQRRLPASLHGMTQPPPSCRAGGRYPETIQLSLAAARNGILSFGVWERKMYPFDSGLSSSRELIVKASLG